MSRRFISLQDGPATARNTLQRNRWRQAASKASLSGKSGKATTVQVVFLVVLSIALPWLLPGKYLEAIIIYKGARQRNNQKENQKENIKK